MRIVHSQPERWTLEAFLDYFRSLQHRLSNRSIAWVLGAGASFASGIPLAGHLASSWLNELHRRWCRDGGTLEQWATAENLGIPGFSYRNAAAFYS